MAERRKRRTKQSIEDSIIQAATNIIIQKGFQGLTATGIMQEASIEPSQFYKRYANLNEFIDEYVKKYDYWFSDAVKTKNVKCDTREEYNNIIINLFKSLLNNPGMQQLLKWELTINNETTQRTANLRELHTLPLSQKYEKIFANTNVDIVAISSLIISGIYYMVIHDELSPFSGIQLNTEEGIERITNAVTFISNVIFQCLSKQQESIELISKMRKDNIPIERISYYTGIPEYVIEKHFV